MLGHDLSGNVVYEEAMKVDELMGIAVRVVYLVVPKEEWSLDRTINLIKKTYKDYKKWRELYENH